ncbi:DDE superfamily endonuclease [Chitinophaga sancti]|uniref:DDE superfamily endonuclease n=2 Tax=Chitinophaga sancti TaxID=1004 RepID=A0A1K1RUS6_9BACT|nr:DDE superfamily endonuclease [Chitinophaga sancti]
MISLFEVWLCLPVRYTISNLSRFGTYCEKSIRLQMEKEFDFGCFNSSLIKDNCGKHLIAAYDPTYLPKSGKHTPGLGKFWSGKDQKAVKGLEIGCLAIIDVDARTAFPLKVVQTPDKTTLDEKGMSRVDHYVDVIKSEVLALKSMVDYLAVDSYFMKQEFILPILKEGLHIVTKMRSDANLIYVYNGPRSTGPGRPRIHGDKVSCGSIDKRKIREFAVDNDAVYYSSVVWSAILKCKVRIVYIEEKVTGKYEILLCTDIELKPELILNYYQLRFQIEFLIRDAKQHGGLEECQAGSEKKLHFHFNMAFATVGLAKVLFWMKLPDQQRGAFSMRNIKMAWYNRFLTDRIFSNLPLDLNCNKIKKLYQKCLDIGNLAA